MAQESNSFGSNLPVASIVALVLFASGLWVTHQPLQSDRPGVELKQQKDAAVHQDVEARLWQDPLEAIKRDQLDGAKSGQPPAAEDAKRHEPEAFRNWVATSAGRKRLILPVMVFGGPYAEDAEQRRRTRYAVLSGLRESNYEPETSRRIGYVAVGKGSEKMLIPFEKWQKIGVRPRLWDEVFVLWIAEDGLGQQPVDRLGAVLDQLVAPGDPAISVTVLGPASDRMAQNLAAEVARRKDAANAGADDLSEVEIGMGQARRKVRFVAPVLSIPSALLAEQLVRAAKDSPNAENDQARLASLLNDRLKNLRIGPDDAQLARLLIEELANRGVSLPVTRKDVCDDQIALVVEADTHYARSLTRAVMGYFKDCDKGFRPFVFHYFRGLDGKVAQDDAQAKKADSGQSDKAKQDYTPYQERAQGQGQFDYLRRIADEIRRRSDEQQREVQKSSYNENAVDGSMRAPESFNPVRLTNRGAVRAVIVIGSDIHDKLAVLHALRESLPQAVFATTDLDAGLLQKEQLSWTRNLVVASGFDLKLPAELQKGATPFRDTYQTATYLATRRVLDFTTVFSPAHDAKAADPAQKVRLFEIGNQGAVALRTSSPSAINPDIKSIGGNSVLGQSRSIVLATLVFAIIFGAAISWCVRQFLFDLVRLERTALVKVVMGGAVLMFFFALVFCIGRLARLDDEEPLFWFAGISAWPAALICTVASMLALVFYAISIDKLNRGEETIEEEFFKAETDSLPKRLPQKVLHRLAHEFQDSWFPSTYGVEETGLSHAYSQWLKYKTWGSWRNSAWRLSVAILAVLVIVYVLATGLGLPPSPVRGYYSQWLHLCLVALAYLLTLGLVVWTLDRVALCSLFLRRLFGTDGVRQRSGWSAGTKMKFCGGDSAGANQKPGENPDSGEARAVEGYIDLRLAARLSQMVSGVIVYPFIVTLLLIVARARYFDNWNVTVGYVAVILVIMLLLAIGAFALRHNAERMRRDTIAQFDAIEFRQLARNYQTSSPVTREQLARMKEIALNLKEGAFAPFSSQPIVRAFLLPFGGAGLINLLDFVMV